MAETKAGKRKGASKTSKSKAAGANRKNNGGRKQAPRKRPAKRSNAAKSNDKVAASASSIRDAVEDAGQSAGSVAGQVVKKGAVPLAAGSAALIAAAGGIAFGAKHSGGKVLGLKLPQAKRVKFRSKDLTKAAKELGRFGENVGDLSSELRSTRKALASGNGSSPIELLLKGLTTRLER